MKLSWLFCALLCIALPIVAQTITVEPNSMKRLPPLTSMNVNQDLVRGACADAVKAMATASKRIDVFDVSVVPMNDKRIAACVVTANAMTMEGMGIYISGDTTQISQEHYSVNLNLETGNVDLTRIDENAARQVALNALVAKLIVLKPAAIEKEKIAYKALVAGKKCVVEVANNTSHDSKRWLVTKLDCSASRGNAGFVH